jgi:hypothetical protein
VITVQLAPQQVIAALSVDFHDSRRADEVEAAVLSIERKVRRHHHEVVGLFVKPQTVATYREAAKARFGEPRPQTLTAVAHTGSEEPQTPTEDLQKKAREARTATEEPPR